jgi:hypothetical protein
MERTPRAQHIRHLLGRQHGAEHNKTPVSVQHIWARQRAVGSYVLAGWLIDLLEGSRPAAVWGMSPISPTTVIQGVGVVLQAPAQPFTHRILDRFGMELPN